MLNIYPFYKIDIWTEIPLMSEMQYLLLASLSLSSPQPLYLVFDININSSRRYDVE